MASLAKLTRPRQHEVVLRERLFAQIEAARSRYPVIWVTGPPGAGKTTLVASYLDGANLAGAWYQIDAGDNDISTFFYYLSRTVESPKGKRQAPLPLLTPEYLADIPGYTRHFFREYYSRLKVPAVLTLDNYHQLPHDSAFHGVLEQALREVPEEVNVVVISREDPPPECVELVAAELLTCLDWDDLRLTLVEARAIAALRLDMDETTVRALYEMSVGWAAGWTLSLERARRLGPQAEDVQGEALESIFSYFAGQIFRTSAPETREFLIRTALLPVMTVAIAEKLGGNPHAGELLDRLYRRHLFTDRRGTKPYSYQYHDLFRAFLLDQLERVYTPAEINELRQHAGRLLEETGQVDDAFRLYGAAQDWGGVTRLILGNAQVLLGQGRGETLREWIGVLPKTIVNQAPWLVYWLGGSLISSAPSEARGPLGLAFELMEQKKDRLGQILACAGMILTYAYDFSSFTSLDRWIDALDGLLQTAPEFPSPVMELQVNAALVWALAYRRPDLKLLEPRVHKTEELLASDNIPVNEKVAMATALLGCYFIALRHTDGERLVDRIQALLTAEGLTPVIKASWYLFLGLYIFYSEGENSAAQDAFTTCLEICDENAIASPTLKVYPRFGLAHLAIERSDLFTAESYRAEAERYVAPDRLPDQLHDTWLKVRLAEAHGDLASAIQFDEQRVALSFKAGAPYFIHHAYLRLAVHLTEAGRFAEAAKSLQDVRTIVQATGIKDRWGSDIAFAESYGALLQGNRRDFEERFRCAVGQLKLTGPWLGLRGHEGHIMPRLFAAALEAGVEIDYVHHLIRRCKVRPPSLEAKNWPWPVKVHTLGRFEVLLDNTPLAFARKAPKKPLQLLKALIAFGATDVPEQKLTDAVWPDETGDRAHNSFSVALTRLRKLLGDADAIGQNGGRVSLNRDRVWIDAVAFERTIGDSKAEGASNEDSLRRAIDYYRGSFLSDDTGEPWTVSLRERLRSRFIAGLSDLARHYEQGDQIDAAINLYRRGIEADELAEDFYRGLMRCYRAREERAEALTVYRRLKQILSVTLGIGPSPATEQLASELRMR